MKKILHILRIISIIVILFLAALVFIPNILGITPTIDLLGLMEPKISKGSISYTNRRYNYKDIKKNDIIEIKMYNQNIMVRVQTKNEKDNTLNVKGDAESKQEIKVISKKEYVGKHIFSIPKVGLLVLFMQRFFFLTIILVIIIVISLIADYLDYKKEDITKNTNVNSVIKHKNEKNNNKLKNTNDNINKENNKEQKNQKEEIEILDEEEIKEISKILKSTKDDDEML